MKEPLHLEGDAHDARAKFSYFVHTYGIRGLTTHTNRTMKTFVRNIERQVGINRLEAAIDELLDTLGNYNPATSEARQEVADLRKYIIGLSQRLYEANDNRKRGTINDADVSMERRNVGANLIELVNDFHRYPQFADHLKLKADEAAWQRASTLNTIEAYQEYFTEFPDGKYKEQTHRLIVELRDVERRRAEEIKRMAEEEKQRRQTNYQQAGTGSAQGAGSTSQQSSSQHAFQRQGFHAGYQGSGSHTGGGTASTDGQEMQPVILIIAGVATLFIPLIGIGLGLYLRLAKKNDLHQYNEQTRKYGQWLLIGGIVMAVINLIVMSGGGGGYYY